jgi:hypothetical protein
MNKYFFSLALASQLMFSHAIAIDPFAKLKPKISRHAQTWSKKVVESLNEELQLVFINLFALSSEDTIQAFIKCAEYIEMQPDMLPLYEELGTGIMDIIKLYAESVQEKIAQRTDITEKEKESLWNKLEIKIQELVTYINTIYYQALHQLVSKRNPSSLMFMFDENGMITAEKRTTSLPNPF